MTDPSSTGRADLDRVDRCMVIEFEPRCFLWYESTSSTHTNGYQRLERAPVTRLPVAQPPAQAKVRKTRCIRAACDSDTSRERYAPARLTMCPADPGRHEMVIDSDALSREESGDHSAT